MPVWLGVDTRIGSLAPFMYLVIAYIDPQANLSNVDVRKFLGRRQGYSKLSLFQALYTVLVLNNRTYVPYGLTKHPTP